MSNNTLTLANGRVLHLRPVSPVVLRQLLRPIIGFDITEADAWTLGEFAVFNEAVDSMRVWVRPKAPASVIVY